MKEPRTIWGLIRYFLYLGSLECGGPVALIGYMQPILIVSAGLIGFAIFWRRGAA